MREINIDIIKNKVAKMCIEANYNLNDDIHKALLDASNKEASPIGKSILIDIIENAQIAKNKSVPMCQDTGMAVFL